MRGRVREHESRKLMYNIAIFTRSGYRAKQGMTSSWILDPANYAQGIRDRPICMLMGRQDTMCEDLERRRLVKYSG